MKNDPIVILLGGVGTSGKSTFSSYVQRYIGINICKEFSSIDPVKEIALKMHELEEAAISDTIMRHMSASTINLGTSPLMVEINHKSDKYRSLLHDIKMAWCEATDGPNIITLCKIRSFFDTGGKVAFLNVREPEQIDHLKDLISKEKNWRCITLCVTRNTYTIFSNAGDRETEGYQYDVRIHNNGTLSDLSLKAKEFANSIQNIQ